jgi:hypothetical protein
MPSSLSKTKGKRNFLHGATGEQLNLLSQLRIPLVGTLRPSKKRNPTVTPALSKQTYLSGETTLTNPSRTVEEQDLRQ